MKCNKCGTPIIPGENTCRICGNKTDFSKREKAPEIIDLPEDMEETSDMSIDLPDLDNIVNLVEEPIKKEEKKEEQVKEIEVPEVVEETIIEDVKKEPIVEDVKIEEVKTEIKEEVKEPIVEVKKIVKSEQKKVLDKANSKPEKVVKPKEKNKPVKNPSNSGMILLSLLLICSLVGNIYLFIINGNAKANGTTEPTEEKLTYSKVSYKNYKLTLPSSWITENGKSSLLIYDDTQNWTASIQVIDNANYEAFVTNKDELVTSLGNLKYQFTSNYSKEYEEHDYYLFKGKYYDYSVYVIVTNINEEKVLVTDLKFKGEVDDILLNNILSVMGNVKENNTTDLFKDNFEFKDISNEIFTLSQNKE